MSSAGLSPDSSRGIFAEAARLQRAGRRAVLVTPIWSRGSVPVSHLSKLLLRDDGSFCGTVGGGMLEARALEVAREIIDRDEFTIIEFDLGEDEAARSGMICGGQCSLLLEPLAPDYCREVLQAAAAAKERGEPIVLVTLLPPDDRAQKLAFGARGEPLSAVDGVSGRDTLSRLVQECCAAERPRYIEDPLRAHLDPLLPLPALFIFGGGHIAIPLAHTADLIGFRVVVIDDREEFASRKRFPRAGQVVVASVADAFRQLQIDESGYVVAVTRGHAMDEDVVAEALRTTARYIGMIGSRRKVAGVLERLRGRGFSEADLARLHSPIGLDIGADTVEEIAVSIAAELVSARRKPD
jgi:xanthine dehydrogenase accessory factor